MPEENTVAADQLKMILRALNAPNPDALVEAMLNVVREDFAYSLEEHDVITGEDLDPEEVLTSEDFDPDDFYQKGDFDIEDYLTESDLRGRIEEEVEEAVDDAVADLVSEDELEKAKTDILKQVSSWRSMIYADMLIGREKLPQELTFFERLRWLFTGRL
jgi:hypothetical protein